MSSKFHDIIQSRTACGGWNDCLFSWWPPLFFLSLYCLAFTFFPHFYLPSHRSAFSVPLSLSLSLCSPLSLFSHSLVSYLLRELFRTTPTQLLWSVLRKHRSKTHVHTHTGTMLEICLMHVMRAWALEHNGVFIVHTHKHKHPHCRRTSFLQKLA